MSAPQENVIDVIIPNWNGRAMLEICLASLQTQTFRDFTITVIDNGSEDDSVDFIRHTYPAVKIIGFPENRGFSAAVNAGIKATISDWVMLLNNDTELDPTCLEILYSQLKNRSEYDFFALKMIAFDQRNVLDGAGDGVLRGGVGYRLGTLETDREEYWIAREVFGACAGAACYHRKIFSKIDLFDEDFFAYLEDVDFNMRAVRAGFRCCYLPDVVVYHIGSATSGSKINRFTVELSTRNNVFVILKNYSLAMILRFLPALAVYQFFWFLFVLKKKQLRGYLAGIWGSLSQIGNMVRKGKELRRKSHISNRLFADLIVDSEREVVKSIMARRRQKGKSNVALTIYERLLC